MSVTTKAINDGAWHRPLRDPVFAVLTTSAILAAVFVCVAAWSASRPSESSAANLLREEANRLNDDIRRVTGPGITRGQLIAKAPITRDALRSQDPEQLTAVCNDAITDATEIDSVALFDSEGRIVAINTLYADWTPIPQSRVDRILGMSFDDRAIIQSCVRNDSRSEVVQFQTACDITPALFDSSGLSIAHSIPVHGDDGDVLGVVSTRMRFDRLSEVVQDRELDGLTDRFHFVTEIGSFLDEAVNAGDEPPLPEDVVQRALKSSAGSLDDVSLVLTGGHALAVVRFEGYRTVDDGGIIAIASMPRSWLNASERSDMVTAAAVPAGVLIVLVSAALMRRHTVQLRASVEREHEEATRLDQLISRSPAAVAMFDRELRYVAASAGWYEQYGLKEGSLTGRCHYDVFPSIPAHWKAIHQRVLAGETVKADRDVFEDEHDQPVWVRYKLCPWTGPAGEIRGLIMFTEVINDRVEHETQLERKRDEALRANADIKALRSALDDHALVSVADRRGRIVDINTAFCRVSGYRQEELIGQDHRILNSGQHPKRFWVDAWQTIASGRAWRGEVCNRRKDGELYWVDSMIVPHIGKDGKPEKYISIRFDITDKKRIEAELEDAMRKAEEANASKSQFLANMSHEIRTPMTAILGYADLLVSDDAVRSDPDQAIQVASSINANGKHLLCIINDILDVSKIEAGQMTVESFATDPVQVVEEVALLMRPAAVSKGIELSVRYTSDIPESIESDPTRLRQILLNLTGNAIKFTSQGSVTVEVNYDPQAWQMIYRVVDTGEGMTPTQRDEVARFEAFRQADASMSRRFGGSGLGLRISNALATMLGGKIEVESTQGEGSTFTVRIATGDRDGVAMRDPDQIMPFSDHAQGVRKEAVSSDEAAASLAGLRILLAEDGPDNQRLISFHLKKEGAEVVVCENGRIACDVILEPPDGRLPDVVLMDMQMPEMDGYEATRTLRARSIDLPIIALTAHAMSGDRERCINAGCTEYLTKPIDKVKLIETCSRLSARRHQRREAA